MFNARTIFFTLFGGVFLLTGLAMFIGGLSEVGVSDDGTEWVLVGMGVIFATAGGSVIWFGSRFAAETKKLELAKEQYPSEPWKWTDRWQTRRIEHNAKAMSVGLWAFAIVWNFIVVTAAILGGEDMLAQIPEEPGILFVFLFPIVGIGVLFAAIRATMQWRRFGTSALVLNHIPIPLGGALEGMLELPKDVRDAQEVLVTLRCLRTTKSGKNTTTTVLWTDERRYPRASMGAGLSGPTLSVHLAVPADEPETSVSSGYPSIRWEVSASAEVAGVDFSADYTVPVFRTHETDEAQKNENRRPALPAVERDGGTVQRTIVRERGIDGTAIWNYPAFRARSAAVFLTGFTLIWSGIVYLLATTDAPGFFAAVFGFFEVLLLIGTIDVLFGRLIVTVDDRGLLVQSGPGIIVRSRRLAPAEVEHIRVKGGMTVGTTMYHTIEVATSAGRTINVGKYLRSRLEAEEIADEMRDELKRHS